MAVVAAFCGGMAIQRQIDVVALDEYRQHLKVTEADVDYGVYSNGVSTSGGH
jgi:hypothetical protein